MRPDTHHLTADEQRRFQMAPWSKLESAKRADRDGVSRPQPARQS
jgi:hypothetical protein